MMLRRGFCLIFAALAPLTAINVLAQQDSLEEAPAGVLEEVIVTARKMGEERVLDISMSTSVISSDLIETRNLVGMDDYLRYQPGTNFVDRGVSRNSVIIRGITADPGRGGAIAGIYVDETPVQGLGFSGGSPDLKLVDIERVEVLRGPQGTLYGGGSMSGTVRTLTRAPDPSAFDAQVALAASQTSGNGDFNSEAEAMINLPLFDQRFALRGVVYRFDGSGYIRNTGSSDPVKVSSADAFEARLSERVSDRGNDTYEGYRLGALWQATDRLDVRLTAMRQEIEQDGFPTTDWRQQPFEQSRYARADGSDENLFDTFRLYNLLIDYGADNWTLLSSTSWTEYEYGFDWDVGLFFLDALEGLEPPYWLYQGGQADVFTQELRWTWDSGERWRVLAGFFYEDQELGFDQVLNWEGGDGLDPFGGFFDTNDREDSDLEQVSVFADLVLSLSEQWEATLGGRHYDFDGVVQGDFTGVTSENTYSESGETWKAGLNWRPDTPSLGEKPLIYFLWSEGFRPGGAVGDPPPRCDQDGDGIVDAIGLPVGRNSDDLESLEFGYKTSLGENRVNLQTALFDINWEGIPIEIPVPSPCAFTLPFNAGSAKSTGLEFSLDFLVTDRLEMSFSASWVEAELTEDAPGLGLDGDRLPGSPEYNAAVGVEYGFDLGDTPGWARADLSWVGDYYSTLQEDPPELGDYFMVDLAAGMDFGRWSLSIFAHNLTDEEALTWANPIWAPYPRGSVLRPRTLGAQLRYRFGGH
jgi:iron complex outermembrane receptor protein